MWEHVTMAAGGSSCFFYVVLVVVLIVMGYLRMKMEQAASEQRKAGPKRPVRPEVPQSEIEVEEPGRRLPPRPRAPLRPPQPQRQVPRPPVVWEAPAPRRPERPQPVARPQPSAQRPAAPTARPPQDRSAPVAPPPARGEPAGQDRGRIASTLSSMAASDMKAMTTPAPSRPDARPLPAAEIRRPVVRLVGLRPGDLQRAFIFSEIFAPPLALREAQKLF